MNQSVLSYIQICGLLKWKKISKNNNNRIKISKVKTNKNHRREPTTIRKVHKSNIISITGYWCHPPSPVRLAHHRVVPQVHVKLHGNDCLSTNYIRRCNIIPKSSNEPSRFIWSPANTNQTCYPIKNDILDSTESMKQQQRSSRWNIDRS